MGVVISKTLARVVLGILFADPVCAQSVPLIPPNNLSDPATLDSPPKFPTLDRINPIKIPSGLEQNVLEPDLEITIKSIEFRGNSVISNAEIESALSSFLGKVMKVRDLPEIERTVTDLYEQKNFIGSGAFIYDDSQLFEIDSATIQLQIVERQVTAIDIRGKNPDSNRLKPYLRKSLNNLIGKILNQDSLANELRFLLNKPSIESLKLRIELTEFINETTLLLDVDAGDIFAVTAILNDGRSPITGSIERGLNVTHNNVSGLGDQVQIDYRNTEGSNIVGLSYQIPVNSSDGTIALDYVFGDSFVTQAPLDQFDLRSVSHTIGASYRQPILRNSSNNHLQELVLGVGLSRYDNQDSISGLPFPLSDSADLTGKTRSLVLSTFQEFSVQTASNFVRVLSDFSYGLPVGTTNDSFFENGEFFKFSLEGEYAHKFSKLISTNSRLRGQITDRDVIVNENFFLGETSSVRGFRPAAIARNNGMSFSQEFQFTVFDQSNHRLEFVPFFDFGLASNRTAQSFEDTVMLASTGFNIRYRFFERLYAAFEFAHPLLGDRNSRGSQVNFNVQWRIW